jgi:hypothetical protein
MTTEGVVLRSTLRPDGTLELAEPVGLPPGPVEVTVKPAPAAAPARAPAGDWWQVLQQIRADREARGFVWRTGEEIDADLNAMRDEWEEHQHALERLQEECQKARQQTNDAEEPG